MNWQRLLLISAVLPWACTAPGATRSEVSGFSPVSLQSGSDEASVRARAVRGDPQAQYQLGSLYFYGQGVARNDAQAVQWLRRSAEQGRAEAQNFLALMYRDGRGVGLDLEQAATWARRSAEQGYARGQGLLGIMSFDGHGVSKDPIEGYKWESLALARTTEEDIKRFASNAVEIMTQAMSKEEIAKAEARAREWSAARQALEDSVRALALDAFIVDAGGEITSVSVDSGPPSPGLLELLGKSQRFRLVAEAKKVEQNPDGRPARQSIISVGALEWQTERSVLLRIGVYRGPLNAFAETFLAERDAAGRWSVSVVPGSQMVS